MLTHYLKIAFRNMWKHKTQSLTGIFGLAFGLACFVPALYWFHYETSYDSFYPDAKHIYRIYTTNNQSGETNELVSGILERKLHEQFPAMQNSTVFFIESVDCKSDEIQHIRLRTIFTDSTFLHVFPQVIVEGDAWQPFQTTGDIVITETMAVRLFGEVGKAVGQQIKPTNLLAEDPPYKVMAVVKDPPANSNLSFDAILSHEQIKLQKSFVETSEKQIWAFASLQMYVRLHPQADSDRLSEQLRNFCSQSLANDHVELRMLPVGDVRYRLNNDVPFTLNFIRLFVAAGILLLFSALFNFLNLYLSLFYQRLREFRLLTVYGASSGQLIRQMIFELTCTIFLALLLACFFVVLVRPAFSGLLGITMEMSQLMSLFAVCGIGIMASMLFIGILLFWKLSRLAMQPQLASKVTKQPVLRRLAVILQLGVSVVLLVAASVVMLQIRFVNHKDLGFDSKGIIYLSGLNFFIDENVRTALMDKLASVPQIESITDTYFTPQHAISPFQMSTSVDWSGKRQTEKPAFSIIASDNRFAETFRIKMLDGEWLDKNGEHNVVLNEEAVRVMGLSEPVGTTIRMTLNKEHEYKIVGVVKDFHALSLRSQIPPTIFYVFGHPTNNLYISATHGQEQDAIQRITAILPDIDPSFAEVHPMLLDEMYNRLNQSEQVGLSLFSALAVVCLLISLFGIYAVATAATQRRRKEIAVRKVVGAGAGEIIRLFFREYTLQVIVAGAVSLPLAYLVMNNWLQGYAYRTNIPWWLLTGVIAGVITVVLLTVLGQVLKAAGSNPAEVVKSE